YSKRPAQQYLFSTARYFDTQSNAGESGQSFLPAHPSKWNRQTSVHAAADWFETHDRRDVLPGNNGRNVHAAAGHEYHWRLQYRWWFESIVRPNNTAAVC